MATFISLDRPSNSRLIVNSTGRCGSTCGAGNGFVFTWNIFGISSAYEHKTQPVSDLCVYMYICIGALGGNGRCMLYRLICGGGGAVGRGNIPDINNKD
jgi:hypothetical protein